MTDELPDSPTGEFILYTTEDGKSRVEGRFENEPLWLLQALMGELFNPNYAVEIRKGALS